MAGGVSLGQLTDQLKQIKAQQTNGRNSDTDTRIQRLQHPSAGGA